MQKNIWDYEFTSRQVELIQGSMLGDGSLRKMNGKHRHSYFAEGHGASQISYAKWKFQELEPLSSYWETREIFSFGKPRPVCHFSTRTHPIFTSMEKNWYFRDATGSYVLRNKRRIKIVPPDLKLTPLSTAIWFFDDGYANVKERVVQISTNSFTFEECEMLASSLRGLGITHCRIDKKKRTQRDAGRYAGVVKEGTCYQPIISISPQSFVQFIDMATAYLPDQCLAYKVDMSGYVAPMSRTERYTNNLKPWIDAGNMSGENNQNSKLNVDKVRQIFALARQGMSNRTLSRLFSVSDPTISLILRGEIWKSCGEPPICFGTLKRSNTSGKAGVYLDKRTNRWFAKIWVKDSSTKRGGKHKNLGFFATKEEAIAKREKAELDSPPATQRKKDHSQTNGDW